MKLQGRSCLGLQCYYGVTTKFKCKIPDFGDKMARDRTGKNRDESYMKNISTEFIFKGLYIRCIMELLQLKAHVHPRCVTRRRTVFIYENSPSCECELFQLSSILSFLSQFGCYNALS